MQQSGVKALCILFVADAGEQGDKGSREGEREVRLGSLRLSPAPLIRERLWFQFHHIEPTSLESNLSWVIPQHRDSVAKGMVASGLGKLSFGFGRPPCRRIRASSSATLSASSR